MSKLYSYILSKIISVNLTELLSGFFLIDKSIFLKLKQKDKIFCGYGDYYVRLLISVSNMREKIKEVPVKYGKRKFGQSKSKFISMAFSSGICLKILLSISLITSSSFIFIYLGGCNPLSVNSSEKGKKSCNIILFLK